jgi:precorrin-2 dehydrogenase/sirohydrochlorin ferrochelatase
MNEAELPAFPVSLLLEGRSCLVVGGGKVALRKVLLLLDAKAEVSVVSPRAREELADLAAAGTIRHLERDFADDDVEGAFLVFAATDDKLVNRRILELCRARGPLCCSVDGNWARGDFVTPAILRHGGLTLAVSTGGRSCRRSRMVKENLSRHMELAESAELLVVGTSHEQLPIRRREPYQLAGSRMDEVGAMLAQVWGIHEFMLLNTCNRVELHAVVADADRAEAIVARIMGFDRLERDEYYVKRGFDAFEHAAAVSAGLFSQLPGEYHVVAQLKEALERGARSGWARAAMQEWVSASLRVSKAIRNAPGGLLGDLEIEDLCVEFLKAECRDLDGRRPLVLGAGTVGTGIVRRLMDEGRVCDWCYHSAEPDLPEAWRGRVTTYPFMELEGRLREIDLIVCATGGPRFVLTKGHAPAFAPDRPVLIVDLTMPRNVDPELRGSLPNLEIADLEDLKHWHRLETDDAGRILDLSHRIIEEHRSLYGRIIQSL